MYEKPFSITKPVSNNTFSFDKRVSPKLYVPSVIEGTAEDVQIGHEIVFEDIDNEGFYQSCVGLKHFVKMRHPETGASMVIVDNHNHVFYFWYEAWHQGRIDRGMPLIHIDAHKDTRKPERNLTHEEASDLQKVFEYTNSVLNVGNYIPPAMQEGLIGALISVTSEDELFKIGESEDYNPRHTEKTKFLLNIDLDFWAPEMNYIDENKSLQIIRKLMEKAAMITIATSPFFIDQKRAIEIFRKLF
jgi:DNA helicase IV